MLRKLIYILSLTVLLSACMQDEEFWSDRQHYDVKPYKGLFVVNEGNFTFENSSLSFYNIENKMVNNDVFFNTNGLILGDVAYSMTIHDSLGYIVINNSGKIYVIDINSFELKGVITGLISPRHIHFISNNKAYVTDLYSRSIAIVNPTTYEIVSQIDISNPDSDFNQHATEQMLQHGKLTFTNCWSFDNKILVIDSEIDKVVDSIEVIKQPVGMAIDRNEKLWVLSDGGFEGSPYGQVAPGLMRIDLNTFDIEHTIRFDIDDSPRDLVINSTGDMLFFINRDVYRHPVNSLTQPDIFIKRTEENNPASGYYGLTIDPATSEIYVTDAIDYVQRGILFRFSKEGIPVDTHKMGINPGSFCFKP